MDGIAVRRMEVPNAVLLGQVKEAIREGHTATIKREFEIKLENRQLPVIEQLDINGGLLFKKAVCCDS